MALNIPKPDDTIIDSPIAGAADDTLNMSLMGTDEFRRDPEALGPVKPEEAERIMQKLHDHLPDSNRFQEVMGSVIALKDPQKQQEKLHEYAKELAEEILPYLSSPEHYGALLAFDMPLEFIEFTKLLSDILAKVDEANEKDHIHFNKIYEKGSELYAKYVNLIEDIRKKISGQILGVLKEKGLDKEVMVQNRVLGFGGIGNVYTCEMAGRQVAMKFHRIPLNKNNEWRREKLEKLIQVTKVNENLSEFLGAFLLAQNPDEPWAKKGEKDTEGIVYEGQAEKPKVRVPGRVVPGHYDRRVDVVEIFEGGQDLGAYLYDRGIKTFKFKGSNERMQFGRFLEDIYLPVLQGVKGLHDAGLVHRDLKDENVMIIPPSEKDPMRVKIIDYDLHCENGFQEEDRDKAVGTPSMMSPEQVANDPITTKSDIYTLGKMLYEWAGGDIKKKSAVVCLSQTMSGEYNTDELDIPEDLRSLIRDCMEFKPADRPDIDELTRRVEDLVANNKEELSHLGIMAADSQDLTIRESDIPTGEFSDMHTRPKDQEGNEKTQPRAA